MIIDGRTLPNKHVIESDLCIIGAGAVGITLARVLNGTNIKVAIIESGGLTPDAETQALYEGDGGEGLNYFPIATNRLRYFGGSTNHWGGICCPFDPIDFEQRDWVPYSGWPIAYEEVARYMPEAQRICALGPYDYDYRNWITSNTTLADLGPRFTHGMWQIAKSPTDFAKRHQRLIETSTNVSVYLHSNLIGIDTNNTKSHVTGLRLATIAGTHYAAKAKRYVLACGGIENPRLLLLAGLGGKHAGRFYMGHERMLDPRIDFTCKWSLTDQRPISALYNSVDQSHFSVRTMIKLSDDTQREFKLLNGGFRVMRPITNDTPLAKGLQGFSERLWQPKRYQHDYLIAPFTEQAPDPDSYVGLADDTDRFGLRKVHMRWQRNDLDIAHVKQAYRLFAQTVGALGLGHVQFTKEPLNAAAKGYEALTDRNHHMGATRMAASAHYGVVDKNSKLFDTDNMYVLGSSVFPTVSWGNPTLTIIALSLRFAAQLREWEYV